MPGIRRVLHAGGRATNLRPGSSPVRPTPGPCAREEQMGCGSLPDMTQVHPPRSRGLRGRGLRVHGGAGRWGLHRPGYVPLLGRAHPQAIAASLPGVVATSTTGTVAYLRHGLTNLRLGMTLETALTVGGPHGGLAGAYWVKRSLCAVFGAAMVGVSAYMRLSRRPTRCGRRRSRTLAVWAPATTTATWGAPVRYRVRRLPLGMFTGLLGGRVSRACWAWAAAS